MENKTLTLGSLFDGSGGFPLGGMLAGITPIWASEVEPFAIRVTSKRMPQIKHYGDVSTMDGSKIEPVDIITFGSPCQDMSVAGKRAGLDGNRSSLFYEAVRIIKEMRRATNGVYPRYIVWENVPGAFSSNGGQDFKAVLESIIGIAEENVSVPEPEKGGWNYADLYLGDGWSVAYRVLDAQYWGVPQRRRRIYLVADFGGRSAGDILFKSEGLSRYSAEGFRAWQRTANGFEGCTGETGIGFDGYNGSVDEKAATLGVNCGMSSGRNGVVVNDQPCELGVYENHSSDTRYKGPVKVCQTLSASLGTGGNNQPFVVKKEDTPKTLKVRCGKEGGGKGALIQDDKSATLSTNNDQTVFVPKNWNGEQITGTLTKQNAGGNQRMPDKDNFNCVLEPFGISAKDSNAMKSANPHSGIYKAETSRTLDGNGGNPSCNQGGIAVVESYSLQGNMIGRDDKNGPQGDGVNKEKSFTFNATDRHAVYAMTTGSYQQVEKDKSPTLMARDYKDPNAICYGIGRDTFNQGKNAKFTPSFKEEVQPTMVAKGPGAVCFGFDPNASRDIGQYVNEEKGNTVVNGSCPGQHNGVIDENYTVRRLTPTECARLQGFPDWWCRGLETEKPTDEEVYFWYKVFETYKKITGTGKSKTDKQIRSWLKNPYSDSAEYKLWGNGVALPCVFFVMAGIAWTYQNSNT